MRVNEESTTKDLRRSRNRVEECSLRKVSKGQIQESGFQPRPYNPDFFLRALRFAYAAHILGIVVRILILPNLGVFVNFAARNP